MRREEIEKRLLAVRERLRDAENREEPFLLTELQGECTAATVEGKPVRVWTRALQKALDEHHAVRIPPSDEIYYLDAPVLLGSDTRITACGATVRLLPGTRTLMLRTRHVTDGSDRPEDTSVPADRNIVIEGGRWEESRTARAGYGASGCFDAEHSLPGVSTCMLFVNVRGLTLRDMIFAHCAGFAVQIGCAHEVCVENITFEGCYADGVHLNGHMSDVLVRGIRGHVGDDLVALNPYDWDNSGINFGPAERVWIEGVYSDADNPYKAIRMQPGIYRYSDGTLSDCFIDDLILRRVRGIRSYKLYLQTPRYIGAPEHPALIGHCGDMYFEDLEIDLDGQIDAGLYETIRESEGYNIFGAFEICADIERAEFSGIRLTLHRDALPETCLVSVGPKSVSCPAPGGQWYEIFDPYLTCRVGTLVFRDVTVNGCADPAPEELVRTIVMRPNPCFPAVMPAGGTGRGTVEHIEIIR